VKNYSSICIIVSRYTKEAGIRGLERKISAIMRWAALKLTETRLQKEVNCNQSHEMFCTTTTVTPAIAIDESMLNEILGVSQWTNAYFMLKTIVYF